MKTQMDADENADGRRWNANQTPITQMETQINEDERRQTAKPYPLTVAWRHSHTLS